MRRDLDLPLGPQRPAPQCDLKVADRPHRDGVDHLLMELRIAFRRRQPILRQ